MKLDRSATTNTSEYVNYYDEVSMWSAPFGLQMLQRIPIQAGTKILDVGAGTGFLTIELAQRLGSDCKIVAVDPWRSAMKRLSDKAIHLGLDNVEVHPIDVLELSSHAAKFDLIVSNLGVNNFENRIHVFKALHRLGKVDSRLCFTTNTAGHFSEFYAEFDTILQELGLAIDLLEKHIQARGSQASITSDLGEAGFEVERYEASTYNIRFASGTAFLRHRLVREGFMGDWLTLIPERSRTEVFERVERKLNSVASTKGELSMTVPVTYVQAIKSRNYATS